jgi:hypothetical protein
MHGSALCKQSEDVEQDLRHEIAPSVEVVERAVPVESDGNQWSSKAISGHQALFRSNRMAICSASGTRG